MRLAPIATVTTVATALALLIANFPVEAQERARTRITVQKRSYLDPGTVVKPGTARYHDYANPNHARFPSYGPYAAGDGGYGGSRWPLIREFEGF